MDGLDEATRRELGRQQTRRPRWQRVFRRASWRTNVALLWFLLFAFLSGWVGFAVGSPLGATVVRIVHGLLGIGVIALVPWKSVIISRARHIHPASLLLLVLLVASLASGLVQLLVGYAPLAGVTPIQVHVGAAVVAIGFLAWHVLRHRNPRGRQVSLSRRRLLQGAAFTAVVGAGYLAVSRIAGWTTGSRVQPSATGSRKVDPRTIPATTWLFDEIPAIDSSTHRVAVAGRSLTVAELASTAQNVSARLDCTGGWYADATWQGVRLSDLMPADQLTHAAGLRVNSVTGYSRLFPASDAANLWLAVSCEGEPLSPGNGAPLRLVAPGRRGFWWVKWVASVEISQDPSWRQLPFPAQ